MSGAHEDPLAADRRTLIIAAVAVVALVLLGVVSAAIFTRSACGAIVPDPVEARNAGKDLVATLHDAFPDAAADDVDRMEAAVTALAGSLGPVIAAADVTGARGLTVLDRSGGLAATGTVTTVLDEWGGEVVATARLGDATVAGGGGQLYSLALVNPLTGQVDAMLPLAPDLEPGTCTDTAVVGEPFAFHLDAAAGGLLLFRVEEDAVDPALELVAAPETGGWRLELDTGVAPPGVLAERLTGRLGDELAVVGWRTAPDDGSAVVTAVDTSTGTVRWTTGRDELGDVLSPDRPDVVEVADVGEDLVTLVVGTDPAGAAEVDDAADATRLAAVDVAEGHVAWTLELPSGTGVDDVLVDGDVALAWRLDGDTEVARLREGRVTSSQVAAGEGRRVRALPDGRVLLVGDAAVTVLDRGEDVEVAATAPLVGRDAVIHDGGTSVLLAGPDGGAVVITFGR